MYNINIITSSWSVMQIIKKVPLGVIWNSPFPFIIERQFFLTYFSTLSLHTSVTFFKLSLYLKFKIKILFMSLFLRPTNESGPDMFSCLTHSVTTTDCESPSYGNISISVIMCNPIDIIFRSVPISVFLFDYGPQSIS